MNVRAFWVFWVFVFVAAAYDSYFAYSYRAVLDQWELNPLARWNNHVFGLPGMFGCKALGLAFAIGLALYCRRCRLVFDRPITLITTCLYLLLSAHYLLAN